MKKLFNAISVFLMTLALLGCAASSTSAVGVNCNYSQEKPLSDMPEACQGR